MKVDVSDCLSSHSTRNKMGRVVWEIIWLLFYRPSPKPFHTWRRFLLRLFGAKIGYGAHPHASVKIWAPWNLEMGDHSCLARKVDCYCVAKIKIGDHATVSQYTYLCSATHDYEKAGMPLVTAPIIIGVGAWVAADVFVGPGVTVGDGAVVGARASVFKDVEPWTVVVGNPARFLKRRELKS
jgi:putative colanic acid biosynthesis acetyltransferase WcaF